MRVLTLIKKYPLVLIIFLLGFLLRIIGTSPGYYAHGYEVTYGQAVLMILNKTIGLEYNNLAYPPLVAWLMAASFLIFFIPLTWLGYLVSHFSQINQFIWDPNLLDQIFKKEILGRGYWQNAIYWGRYLTALFGAGSIILIYQVVMQYFQKRAMAIVAALMLAINYRLVLNSHMGFHDIYNVFFILLALWGIGLLVRKPTLFSYTVAAVFASLLFLVKYQPSGFVAFGVAHIIISAKKSQRKLTVFIKNLFKKEVISATLVALTIILVSHIDYFLRLDEVLSYAPSVVWSANEFGKNDFYIYPLSYIYHMGLGKALSIFALGGIIIGLISKKYCQQTLIIGSVVFISFYLFAYFSIAGYYTYNLLIPIVVLLIFSALFLEQTREWIIQKYKKNLSKILITFFYGVILILALKDHLINGVISTYILSQPSYRIVAQDWLNKNISGSGVFGSYSSNPTPQKDNIKTLYLPPIPEAFGFQEFLQEKLDYALIDFYKIHEKLLWWRLPPPFTPIQFWEKPDNLLSQNYLALATRELLWSHTLQAFLPKWQVLGYNYAAVEIKPLLNFYDLTLLKKFKFNDEESWKPLVFLAEDKDKLSWSKEGLEKGGSLIIKAGKNPNSKYWKTLPGSIRWESPAQEVKPDFGYRISGWIRNGNDIEKKFRNGFLRLDFYEGVKDSSIISRPIISFVSSRVYGKSDWQKVEVLAVAPNNANYMRVGFQADDPSSTFYLDEVEIYQTKEKPKLDGVKPYLIKDEDFFNPSDSSFI